MNVSLKKGQEFWLVTNWDSKGTMRIRRLTCQACGKVILRATESVSGDFVKHAIYQRLLNSSLRDVFSFDFEHIFTIDCDIEAEAMKLAEIYIARKEKFNKEGKIFKPAVIYK